MNILFYGDSNTWGFQGDQPQVRLAYEKRFTGIIANRFPQHHIIEEGLPGRTICIDDPLDRGRNGMETLPMLLQTHEPLDLVVIMLGTNDTQMRGRTPVFDRRFCWLRRRAWEISSAAHFTACLTHTVRR